jgi:hypothetical protein
MLQIFYNTFQLKMTNRLTTDFIDECKFLSKIVLVFNCWDFVNFKKSTQKNRLITKSVPYIKLKNIS